MVLANQLLYLPKIHTLPQARKTQLGVSQLVEKTFDLYSNNCSFNRLLTPFDAGGYDLPDLVMNGNKLRASLFLYCMNGNNSGSFSRWLRRRGDPLRIFSRLGLGFTDKSKRGKNLTRLNFDFSPDPTTKMYCYVQPGFSTQAIGIAQFDCPVPVETIFKKKHIVSEKAASWKTVFPNTNTCKDTPTQVRMRNLKYNTHDFLKKAVKNRFKSRAFAWYLDLHNSRNKVHFGIKSPECYACGQPYHTLHLYDCAFKNMLYSSQAPPLDTIWHIICLHTCWIKHSDVKHKNLKSDYHYKSRANFLYRKATKKSKKRKDKLSKTKKKLASLNLAHDDLIIFTDGSRFADDDNSGGTGNSLVAKWKDKWLLIGHRLPYTCTNNFAEYAAAQIALNLHNHLSPNRTRLLTDSLITVLKMDKQKKPNNFYVSHIYSHIGVWGNEVADALAKFCADRNTNIPNWAAFLKAIEKNDLGSIVPQTETLNLLMALSEED
eukprot:TRINITY_DN272_c0_g1_i10.p1 TRINITY_DN272_c0_g1~~TRINITY_DN272_c0_g1_i10.p1  ORF type:complete len:489 (-),score=46.71 TRINITY_DN272_c0_g1_i10:140-1606(-)